MNAIREITDTGTEETCLIESAHRGSLDAFNTLVLRYQARVYGVACQILRDPAAAEDAAQAAFIKTYRKLSSYQGGSFKAWLLKIATRQCLDELRRSGRHPELHLDEDWVGEDDLSLAERLPSDDLGPEELTLQHEQADIVQTCLYALSPNLRLVVELVDLQGMNYAEAAEVLGCPVGTVKSRLARARLQLHRRLWGRMNS
jgi:RNA polymerase sigma-70 factor, ECF subfamily